MLPDEQEFSVSNVERLESVNGSPGEEERARKEGLAVTIVLSIALPIICCAILYKVLKNRGRCCKRDSAS